MVVYLCALAKNEHKYINEWVNHYIKLGVDKIFLFDNDDKGSPYIGDFIDKELRSKVRIINARGIHYKGVQHDFYSNFYEIENRNFDWCLFCDIDEFLVGIDDIKQFLKQPKFITYEQIRVKWKLYGDDNKITRDMSKPLLGAFSKEITKSYSRDLKREVRLQDQAKSIVKGHLKNIMFTSVHFAIHKPNTLLRSCLPSGKLCESATTIYEDYSKEVVFLNHYMTKSLTEFIEQKMNRTDAVFEDRRLKLDYYWRINEKTKDKEEFLKNLGLD